MLIVTELESVRKALEERYPQHNFKWQGRKGLCPEHPDRIPSLMLYDDHAYCFGCGRYFPLKPKGPGGPTRLLQEIAQEWQAELAGDHPEAARARAWLAEMCGLDPEWLISGAEVGEEGYRVKLPLGLIVDRGTPLGAVLRNKATELGLLTEDITDAKNRPALEFIRQIADPARKAWLRTEAGNAVLVFIYEDSPGRVCGFKFRAVGAPSSSARFMEGRQPGVFGLRLIEPALLAQHGAVIVEGETDLLALQAVALRGKHVLPIIAVGGAGRFKLGYDLIVKLEPEAENKIYVWPDADILPKRVFAQGIKRALWPYSEAEVAEKADPRDVVLARAKSEEELRRIVQGAVLTPEALQERERLERVRKQLQNVKIYTAQQLLQEDFPSPRWVIPGLLPAGLALFAGKPKVGKSWLCLGLGLAVAVGGYALGAKPVEKGEALYLALEDSPQRLRARLQSLLESQNEHPGEVAPPAGLHLATEWPRLDEGGLEMLEGFLDEHPQVKLVMIDTLAKIRPRRKGSKTDLGLYDEDYRALEGLQALAQERGIAILVAHHLRKAAAEDPLDMISGTTGLGGVADTALVLQRSRGEADAELFITGRDIEEQSWALQWDGVLKTWCLLGPAEEYAVAKERREVIRILREANEPLKPKEIAEALGQPVGNIKVLLWKMLQDNQVRRVGYGLYALGAASAELEVGDEGEVLPL